MRFGKVSLFMGILCLLLSTGCSFDNEGNAQFLLSNPTIYRVRCLVEAEQNVTEQWIEAQEEWSSLLALGEYRVKVELYQGSQPVGGRFFTLALTKIGRLHQIVVDADWASASGGAQ